MAVDEIPVTAYYLEHLTDDDLVFLCSAGHSGGRGGDYRSLVRGRRGGIDGFLDNRDVFEALFSVDRDSRPLVGVSPFLAFAVAVQWAKRELSSTPYVQEWAGVGRRALVFDAARLAEFMSVPWRRLFLAELLASFTRVASGSVIVATRRGPRRQRFSELDPVRLAGLLDVVADAERPGVLRRLGDLALFLTGVFPDYVARRGFGPVDRSRLLRASDIGPGQRPVIGEAPRGPRTTGDGDAVGLLEELGRRWYRAAFRLLPGPVPANVAVIGEMPQHFNDGRRVLGLIADRFLFPHRESWFGTGPNWS